MKGEGRPAFRSYRALQSPLAGYCEPLVPVQTQVLRHSAILAEARHFGAYSGCPFFFAIWAHTCACCAHVNACAGRPSGTLRSDPATANAIFLMSVIPCDR